MIKNLGAIERVKKPEDKLLATAQAPVAIPSSFVPDLSWLVRNYQGETPFCGEHGASHFKAIREYNDNGSVFRFSPRHAAIKLKTPSSPVYDGFPIGAGTTLPAVFQLLEKIGMDEYEPLENDVTLPLATYCDPSVVTPAMDSVAATHTIAEFAFDALTYEALCQAIYQNKAVCILIKCDEGFWGTTTPTFTQPLYGHFICGYGYDETGIWIIDSAEPNNAYGLKHIAKEYITPQFFYESGTAIDAAPVEKTIQDATTIVQDISENTEVAPAEKETLLQEVEQAVQEIEAIL